MAKSMRVGGGGRFAALKGKIAARGDVRDPGAVAAAIGRAKYGAARFQKMAAVGRARSHMPAGASLTGAWGDVGAKRKAESEAVGGFKDSGRRQSPK